MSCHGTHRLLDGSLVLFICTWASVVAFVGSFHTHLPADELGESCLSSLEIGICFATLLTVVSD